MISTGTEGHDVTTTRRSRSANSPRCAKASSKAAVSVVTAVATASQITPAACNALTRASPYSSQSP